jgi:hypothetical protein
VCDPPSLKKRLLDRRKDEVSRQAWARDRTGRLQKSRAGMYFEPGEMSLRIKIRPGRWWSACPQIWRRSSVGRLGKSVNVESDSLLLLLDGETLRAEKASSTLEA